jgi:hypothetical protein
MLGFPMYMLAKERQKELVREVKAARAGGLGPEKRFRLPDWLMVRMGTLMIRVGLDLLERYEPALFLRCETCQPATGATSAQ